MDSGRGDLNYFKPMLSQAVQPNIMIKEALLCGLSAIADFSGVHYHTAAPKVGTIRTQTAIYWKNVGKYIATGIAAETPKIQAAKQKQLELDLTKV